MVTLLASSSNQDDDKQEIKKTLTCRFLGHHRTTNVVKVIGMEWQCNRCFNLSRLRFRRKYHKVHQGDLLSPKPLKHYFPAFWSNYVNQGVAKYKNCIPELVSANRAKSGKRFQSKAILRLVQRYLTKIIETFSPYKQCKKRTEK